MAKPSKAAQREMAQQLAREGQKPDQIKAALINTFGASYRRQELLRDIREAKGQERIRPVEEVARYTPTKYKEAVYETDLATKIRDYQKKYNHIIEYKLYNYSTRQTTTEHLTLATDEAPTKGVQRDLVAKATELIQASLTREARPATGSPTIWNMLLEAEDQRRARKPKAKRTKKPVLKLKKDSVKYLYTIERLD